MGLIEHKQADDRVVERHPGKNPGERAPRKAGEVRASV